MVPHLKRSWTTKQSSWVEKLQCRLKDKLAVHWKAPVLCTPGAFPLLLLLSCCPAVTPAAAAAAVALPPAVPLGKKTQRFREVNTLTHTFEQCAQHWDSSTLCTGRQGVIKDRHCHCLREETGDTFGDRRHMCKQLNQNSVALNILNVEKHLWQSKKTYRLSVPQRNDWDVDLSQISWSFAGEKCSEQGCQKDLASRADCAGEIIWMREDKVCAGRNTSCWHL